LTKVDQGCQFTSDGFEARLNVEKIQINWTGWKRCHHTILVARLWRTGEKKEVVLSVYSDDWWLGG
jgi:hypothetical protein